MVGVAPGPGAADSSIAWVNMIVWINGAFGVGKTSVARRIVARVPRAVLVDPEILGLALSAASRRRGDFQDLASWRRWTVRVVALASAAFPVVVVPMTIVNPPYFDEIVGALRRRADVRHFALVASAETVRARLRRRGGAGAWAEEQIVRCVDALAAPAFARHVSTEDRGFDDVAGDIAGAVGLKFRVAGSSRWR